METPEQLPNVARELPVVAGHLALDFANTVDDPLGPARHDHIATYPGLLRWAARVGVLDDQQAERLRRAGARSSRAEVTAIRRAHQLRRVLNDLFGGILDQSSDVPEQWLRLRPFVTSAIAAASLGTGELASRRHSWMWPQEELDLVLHPVAMAAAELLVGQDLPRLKRCARCPWLFLDRSKNHSRRWCDMNDCGKAQKIERYVARRAARRSLGRETNE